MSIQPVSPAEVRRHIWESLVSMIRVYTHAASLNTEGYGIASTAQEIWVTYGECTLHISYSPETGVAQSRLKSSGQEVEGVFTIDDHGQVLFPEGPRELDEAAIHWVQQLGQSTCAA